MEQKLFILIQIMMGCDFIKGDLISLLLHKSMELVEIYVNGLIEKLSLLPHLDCFLLCVINCSIFSHLSFYFKEENDVNYLSEYHCVTY